MSGESLLLSLGKIGLAVAVVFPLLIYFTQDSLIFFRQPLTEGRRAEIARQFPAVRQVFLHSKDDVRLQAWHVPGSGPLVIYFGGNAEEVSWMIPEALTRAPGVAWLLVSYRGYGGSEGVPSEAALTADALQWYDHAASELKPESIFVFGRSLGSGPAVFLAAGRKVAGAILVTPFDSLSAVAKRHYWYLPVDWMLKHRFDSDLLAPKLGVPLLCLIATRDEVIPPAHGERLFDAWGGPKKKVLLQDAGHNSTDAHPLFWSSIREFLGK
jgi:pimeloyl-ACP methyl ester carboxylesterase